MSWAVRETQTANLGDQRLNKRMTKLLDSALSQPTASIPVACRGWQETLAAYRFFDNPKVKAENVLAPHRAAAHERMAKHDIVLCVQDTTELDYSGQSQTQGVGLRGPTRPVSASNFGGDPRSVVFGCARCAHLGAQ